MNNPAELEMLHYSHRQYSVAREEIENLFNKRFEFRFKSNWKLPDHGLWFTVPPWKVQTLESLKSRLNFRKSQLNDFDIEEWSSHTRSRNPAGEVCWRLRSYVNPEFLTQAWTKFYECAYSFNIVPESVVQEKKYVSLHLCEAPGAFITSLNHYLKSLYPDVQWQWLATTLNPYYEGNSVSNMISDDRFMFHTLDHWDFGVDTTGNLMSWSNSQALINRAKGLGKVMLVTADGSIDCLERPDAQEEVTSPLHYCETVTALQALSEGGTFIFKLFTTFEHSTVNLLYLINDLFEHVNIYKPVTSRQGNSEVYAVCLNYKGYQYIEPYVDVLEKAYGTSQYETTSLFPLESLPSDFLKQIEECANYFCSIQCQVINNNLQAYSFRNAQMHKQMKFIRSEVADLFLHTYKLEPLSKDMEILKGELHEKDKGLNTNPRYHRGSYTTRQTLKSVSLKEKAAYFRRLIEKDMQCPLLFNQMSETRKFKVEKNEDVALAITHGRPLENINSSKFIFLPVFKIYKQIVSELQFRDAEKALSNDEYVKERYGDCKLCQLPMFDHCEPYFLYEKRCFKMLLDCLKDCCVGETVLLQNFNTLSHFSVSILYLLGYKCFEELEFTYYGIVLRKFIDVSILDEVWNLCETNSCNSKDVLNVLPIQVVYSSAFYQCVVYYNNSVYRRKCLQMLDSIDESE